jgi:hypothetical protein
MIKGFASVYCHLLGHKRGKRIKAASSPQVLWFECPRCKAQWSRKTRDAKVVKK